MAGDKTEIENTKVTDGKRSPSSRDRSRSPFRPTYVEGIPRANTLENQLHDLERRSKSPERQQSPTSDASSALSPVPPDVMEQLRTPSPTGDRSPRRTPEYGWTSDSETESENSEYKKGSDSDGSEYIRAESIGSDSPLGSPHVDHYQTSDAEGEALGLERGRGKRKKKGVKYEESGDEGQQSGAEYAPSQSEASEDYKSSSSTEGEKPVKKRSKKNYGIIKDSDEE